VGIKERHHRTKEMKEMTKERKKEKAPNLVFAEESVHSSTVNKQKK